MQTPWHQRTLHFPAFATCNANNITRPNALKAAVPVLIPAVVCLLMVQPASGLRFDGHRSVTQRVAAQLGFSTFAAQILSQGSMEPDAYQWNSPQVHAQTPCDDTGTLTESVTQAEAASLAYMSAQAARVKAEIAQGNLGNALYFIGYSLHTIQDLASHAGMSNFDHSFLSRNGHNPDLVAENLQRAQDWTVAFFQGLQSNLDPCVWDQLRTLSTRTRPTDHFRESPKYITALNDYREYDNLGKNPPNYYKSVRWQPLYQFHDRLQNSFTSGLNQGGFYSWLFEGDWVGGGPGTVSIHQTGAGFTYHRATSDRTWSLIIADDQLSGALLMTKAFLDSQHMPAVDEAQVLGRAKQYLKLKFDHKSCEISAQLSSDDVFGQFKNNTPTGLVRIDPDSQSESTFTLKRGRDATPASPVNTGRLDAPPGSANPNLVYKREKNRSLLGGDAWQTGVAMIINPSEIQSPSGNAVAIFQCPNGTQCGHSFFQYDPRQVRPGDQIGMARRTWLDGTGDGGTMMVRIGCNGVGLRWDGTAEAITYPEARPNPAPVSIPIRKDFVAHYTLPPETCPAAKK